MALSPVCDNLLINSILTEVGTTDFSFCRPSRGPTSTILTLEGNAGCMELRERDEGSLGRKRKTICKYLEQEV